ncbi:hypothetical protein [Streptomyces sp. HPF1205]|uniref:hypothetical protein n=1 Tax=Streptomyces sp. HPF1205 TaxID=2873262 RepID=UPI001CEC9B1C|nr:hypothetical protein [Streptomyces sp. HPF1205]
MGAAWVAGVSRSKALLSRCLGAPEARDLAASRSLDAALRRLSTTAYRRFLLPDASLAQAQRAVSATLLWHLRVLAGWLPRQGARALRALAAGFEISNTEDLLRSYGGEPAPHPYRLGALATAWGRLGAARGPGELRAALAASAWGDPGGEDPASLAVSLRLAACAQVAAAAAPAEGWAAGRAALLVARVRFVSRRTLPAPALRRADALLGPRSVAADSFDGFRSALRPAARWALDGVADPVGLWRAEARWWATVDREGRDLLRATGSTGYGPAPVVGAVAALSADAWRVRAALQAAGHGEAPLEVLDAAL